MLLFLQWLPFLPASRPEQLNKKRPATVWQPEDLAGMPRLAALARLLLLLPLDWLLALSGGFGRNAAVGGISQIAAAAAAASAAGMSAAECNF
eukprot:CAMPEP_0172936370 /NCGR_PEP_ID=MMETSP1075-20121228/221986_1 /TAXON_ID=2916 /ORGANISM="Ceratium fusus, Strain PA161109" /LENGTH=92 /DNA_ID=CAMNT_0013797741 /DNA_START=460 /DNA_END=738 /DNA_ORIENTATION=+